MTLVSVTPRVPDPGAAPRPQIGGVGLTVWPLLKGGAVAACVLGRCLPGLQPSRTWLAPSLRTSPRTNLTEPYQRPLAALNRPRVILMTGSRRLLPGSCDGTTATGTGNVVRKEVSPW